MSPQCQNNQTKIPKFLKIVPAILLCLASDCLTHQLYVLVMVVAVVIGSAESQALRQSHYIRICSLRRSRDELNSYLKAEKH